MRLLPNTFRPIWLRLITLACLVFSWDAQAFWNSTSQAEKDLESMGYALSHAKEFGEWRAQGQAGSYRVIVLEAKEKYPHGLVFLQWIKRLPDGSGSMIASVPIKEINYTAAFELSEPKVADVQGVLGGVVELTGVNGYTRSVQGFRIEPSNIGQYSLVFINGPTDQFRLVIQRVENTVFSIPVKE